MRPAPDAPLLADLPTAPCWPVFILGLHRSGTTLLYSLLAATGRFSPVTAYHLAHYDELLRNRRDGLEETLRARLTRRLAAKAPADQRDADRGSVDRGIDNVAATADTPEEYAFLLLEKSGQRHLTRANVHHLVELTRKVRHLAGDPAPPLLKNPHDLGAAPLIMDAFPGARFLFIHRHPLHTLSSSIRALRALVASENPYTAALSEPYRRLHQDPTALLVSRLLLHPRNPLGPWLLALGAAGQVRRYLRNLERIPPDRVTEVCYEDLCAQPARTLARALEGLGEGGTDPSKLEALVGAVSPRRLPLDPALEPLALPIQGLMRSYYDRFGYGRREPWDRSSGVTA